MSSDQGVNFDYGFTLSAFPELVEEWDDKANGRQAADVDVFSESLATWHCSVDPEHTSWTMAVREAVAMPEGNPRCPSCRGDGVSMRSLAVQRPDLAELLSPESGDPAEVSHSSYADVLWLCAVDSTHEPYRMTVRGRTMAVTNPCPSCYGPTTKWTEERLLAFVRDLDPTSPDLNPAQLFAICQQNGLLRTRRGTLITNAILNGQVNELRDLLGVEDLPQYQSVEGESGFQIAFPGSESAIDNADMGDMGVDDAPRGADIETSDDVAATSGHDHTVAVAADADPEQTEAGRATKRRDLPDASTQGLLTKLGVLVANCDEETADYLAASAVRTLWDKAYELDRLELSGGDAAQIAKLRADLTPDPPDNAFAETIWDRFSSEYQAALDLKVPEGWAFTPLDPQVVVEPNLMQRHVATMVRDRRRYGNWSGTGAGKTVSAVLGARLIGAGQAGIVLVVCPNSVVTTWASVIRNCFRDARVATKTLFPEFGPGGGDRWLVINYDMLPGKEGRVRALVEQQGLDMLIIDEVHYIKHRNKHEMSQRRQVLTGVATMAAGLNPRLAVLPMSATPVVNDLHEARSLLEVTEGKSLDDVSVQPCINDAMSIHQRIVCAGTRWMPTYEAALDVETIRIDAGHLAEDLQLLGKSATPLEVERLLLDAKMDAIIAAARETRDRGKRTLIYVQFVDGIVEPLVKALEAAGLRCGLFTGDDKDGLAKVRGISGAGERVHPGDQADVLIGSEAVGTGVDGLQHVCDTLIFGTLPWTFAAYMQVVGRVHRQGQASEKVRVVIPATYIDVHNGGLVTTWSWDDKAWARITNKRTLADCAVDGVVPDREMVTPTQAIRSHLRWLARLMEGDYTTVQRQPLDAGLGEDVDRLSTPQRATRYGDLSRMNGVWGSQNSRTVHERLSTEPEEWHRYHRLYRAARLTWDTVPALVFAAWLANRPEGQKVADLGCGEMLLADALQDQHQVDGYDHVAHDDRVVVADISQVPAPDGAYDYVVLSLALMGANHTDYIREAHRLLRTDGYLWLAEPTSHLGPEETVIRDRFSQFGFDVTTVAFEGQFVFVRATKGDRAPLADPVDGPPLKIKSTIAELKAAGTAVRQDA